MAIVRAARPQGNFYILDKRISEDSRLSWGARGMLIFLLGKPDHWSVNISALISETAESAKPSGRDSVYGLLTELIESGYVTRQQAKGGNGKFDAIDYFVSEICEEPLTENPEAAPLTALPHTAQPHTANPLLVSIDGVVKTEALAKTEVKRFDARTVELPEGVPLESWRSWCDYRKEQRKPLAKRAVELQLRLLGDAATIGHDVKSIIDTSIRNSWTGLFMPKGLPANTITTVAKPSRLALSSHSGVEQSDLDIPF